MGLLVARTVFLQAHVYIHQERSGVCKQGSEQTAGTPTITLPPPQPSPAAGFALRGREFYRYCLGFCFLNSRRVGLAPP